jgi:hypothetical protein
VQESVGKLFPAYKIMRCTGFGDANFTAGRDGVWFFEKCERLGYNAHPNLLFNLSRRGVGEVFAGLIDNTLRQRGIPEEGITEFDIKFEQNKHQGLVSGEPGDNINAPYRKEHFSRRTWSAWLLRNSASIGSNTTGMWTRWDLRNEGPLTLFTKPSVFRDVSRVVEQRAESRCVCSDVQ